MVLQVIVDLGMATICFLGSCHPALIGHSTPVGEFQLTHYAIENPRYGGDILVFKIEKKTVYAIHRVLNIQKQKRIERLAIGNQEERKNVTLGCINIDPVVYDQLVDCCSDATLIIKK